MTFPADILDSIGEGNRRRLLGDDDDSWLSVELVYFPGVENPLDVDINLKWEIRNITEDFVDIKITFTNPIEVSQEDEADFVIITMTGFEIFVDSNGRNLPNILLKKIAIPAQYASVE